MCYHERAREWDALAEELGEELDEREAEADRASETDPERADGEPKLADEPVPTPSD